MDLGCVQFNPRWVPEDLLQSIHLSQISGRGWGCMSIYVIDLQWKYLTYNSWPVFELITKWWLRLTKFQMVETKTYDRHLLCCDACVFKAPPDAHRHAATIWSRISHVVSVAVYGASQVLRENQSAASHCMLEAFHDLHFYFKRLTQWSLANSKMKRQWCCITCMPQRCKIETGLQNNISLI